MRGKFLLRNIPVVRQIVSGKARCIPVGFQIYTGCFTQWNKVEWLWTFQFDFNFIRQFFILLQLRQISDRMNSGIIYASVVHTRLEDVNWISQSDADLFADATHVGQIQANSCPVKLQLFHIYSALFQFFRTEWPFQCQFRLIYVDLVDTSFQNFSL